MERPALLLEAAPEPLLAVATHLPQAEWARAAGLAQQLQAATQAAQQAQEQAEHSTAELAAEQQARQAAQVRRGEDSHAGRGRSI